MQQDSVTDPKAGDTKHQVTATSVKDEVLEVYTDLGHEIAREAGGAHDSSQSDVLVKKHVTGLAISFFVLIGLVLLAAIAGIALYRR